MQLSCFLLLTNVSWPFWLLASDSRRVPMKYAIHTFGCRVNQADSFEMEERLRARGGVEAPADEADLVVVNTCTVTGAADQGARNLVRRIARRNASARIVVTGCYATREPEALASLPGVVRLVPNAGKDALIDGVWPRRGGRGPLRHAARARRDGPHGVPASRADRVRRAVRVLRDSLDARRVAQPDASRGAGRGDAPGGGRLQGTLARRRAPRVVRARPRTARIAARSPARARPAPAATSRFGSARSNPWTVRARSSTWWRGSGRFAPHFHLPLQHGADRVLAAMRRPYSVARTGRLVEHIRARLPHASIGTDIIVGFPGESEADARESERVIASLPLSYLHVFPYSDRPGTEAAAMTPKVVAGEPSSGAPPACATSARASRPNRPISTRHHPPGSHTR